MAMVGADVDQLRTLARTLLQAADHLNDIALDSNLRVGITAWRGPDADRFQNTWTNDSAAKIRAVITALREAAEAVKRNADEQERASSLVGMGVGGLGHGESLLPGFFGNPGSVQMPDVMPWIRSEPLKPFSDIRNYLGNSTIWPIQNETALGQSKYLGPVLPFLDALGIAGDSTLSPDQKLIETATTVGGVGAGMVKEMPGGYFAGAAAAQWLDVARLASEADFSPATRQNVADYIASDPGGAFDAAKDAVIGYVPSLVSNLLPALPFKMPF
ncbi:Uncharacterised protein [Mycobacteroides abscessus subsp. abscessus]|nr:Uncharacterised protein [Mycobacteroides abscessus subsp. abscessus]